MSAVDEWLQFAADDLAAAEVLLDAGLFNQVLFHAQQCVEKSLKAVLLSEGKRPPRTHQLASLVSMISSVHLDEFREGYELLDQIYMPARYPDALPGALPEGLPTQQQAAQALETARQIFALVKDTLLASNG